MSWAVLTTEDVLIEFTVHDIDEASQLQDEPRGHGKREVRNVARDLGLFNGSRPGWTMLAELQSQPGAGNMGIFQKV